MDVAVDGVRPRPPEGVPGRAAPWGEAEVERSGGRVGEDVVTERVLVREGDRAARRDHAHVRDVLLAVHGDLRVSRPRRRVGAALGHEVYNSGREVLRGFVVAFPYRDASAHRLLCQHTGRHDGSRSRRQDHRHEPESGSPHAPLR